MRHLFESDVPSTLRRARSVEQFIGVTPGHAGYVRFVELRPVDGGVEVWVFDVKDLGNADYLDLYSFPYLEAYGPEKPLATLPGPREAMEHAHAWLSACPLRWVNAGVVDSEYEDFLLQRD